MNRSLAAAAALAATLGVAGLALAQTNPAPEPASGAKIAPATAAPATSSPATIKQAQQTLKSQGLYRGPVNGAMGPATQAALSRYQRKEGLPQTAMLDSQTLKHLLPGSFSDAKAGKPTIR